MDGDEKRETEELDTNSAPENVGAEGDASASEVVVTEELASGEPVETSEAEAVGEVATGDDSDGADEDVAGKGPAEEEVIEEEPVAEDAPAPRKIKMPEVEVEDEVLAPEDAPKDWYILKVAFNREEGVRDALLKQIKISGLDGYFGEVLVPTEDIVEFTRAGKRKIVKRKLYPGYLMVFMHVNDDTWFLVRDTNGVSDFTGTAGRPAPMDPAEVERVIKEPEPDEDGEIQLKTSIPFKVGERVRVKEGSFQNQEGEVVKLDEANGKVGLEIDIFGRKVELEVDHWQVEPL